MGLDLAPEDTARYLHGSYVLWKGEPYYMYLKNYYSSRHNPDNLYAYKVGESYPGDADRYREPGEERMSSVGIRIDVTSDDLDLTSMRAGYCKSLLGKYRYVPISSNNSGFGFTFDRHVDDYNRADIDVTSKAFYDCLMGNHMSLDEALDAIQKGATEACFHRYYLLKKEAGFDDCNLLYKNKVIGSMCPIKKSISFRKGPMSALYRANVTKVMAQQQEKPT